MSLRFGDNPLRGFSVPPFEETRIRPEWGTVLFRSLMKNETFASNFKARFLYHLNTTFAPSRVLKQIDDFERLFDPEMSEHIQRWRSPGSKKIWHHLIEDMRTFATQRPDWLRKFILRDLGNPLHIYPNPNSGDFAVKLDSPIGNQLEVEMYNLQGEKLMTASFATNQQPYFFQLDSLNPGIYFLQITDGTATYMDKVVIQKK